MEDTGIRPVGAPTVVAGAAPAEPLAAATPSAAPDPTAAAFFDVDNTVIRGASIFAPRPGAVAARLLHPRDIAAMAWKQARFIAVGENLEHLDQIREQALAFVAGHSVAELTAIGEEIYDEVDGRQDLARHPRPRAWGTWTRGRRCGWSPRPRSRWRRSSPTGSACPARSAPWPRASTASTPVGWSAQPLHGAAKATAVSALAEREGLDLSRCAAYSDSANDIPMLSLVGHPCAVNPDAALRGHARARGWQVVDYRRGRRAAKLGLRAAAATALAGALAASARRRRS